MSQRDWEEQTHDGPAKWLAGLAILTLAGTAVAAETLPSWNDGAAKQGIVAFVDAVTKQGGKDFVPAPERIAVFDNDGTLWSEQPIYVQFAFMLDQRTRGGAEASGMAEQRGVQCAGRRTTRRRSRRWVRSPCSSCSRVANSGMTRRRVRQIDPRLAGERAPSAAQAPVHGARLRADAGAARLSARERLQDLHRLGRLGRIHAALGGAGVRHSAGADHRQPAGSEFRDARGQAGARRAARRSSSSTTAPASRWASIGRSAAGQSPRSAIPTAICRCCRSLRRARAGA